MRQLRPDAVRARTSRLCSDQDPRRPLRLRPDPARTRASGLRSIRFRGHPCNAVETHVEGGRRPARGEAWGRCRRVLYPAIGQPPHHARGIRSGCQLRDELLDLALGLVSGPPQQRLPVRGSQVWRQLHDGGQVKTAVGQHRQEDGVLPRGARHRNAQVGLSLREVEDLRALGEHRGRGRAGVEATPVDLADVSDEVGFGAPGLPQQSGETAQQLVVGD